MISSIDPAPSVISCGGQRALFLSACPQGFQEIFQQGAKGPQKIAALLRQPTTPPAWFGTPRDPLSASPSPQLHCARVWPYGMPVIRPHRRFFHPRTGPAAKVFGREGRGEGEPFSKKVSFSPLTKHSYCGSGQGVRKNARSSCTSETISRRPSSFLTKAARASQSSRPSKPFLPRISRALPCRVARPVCT